MGFVRPGRECKSCGENRAARMVKEARSTDGMRMRCLDCHGARQTELRVARAPELQARAESRRNDTGSVRPGRECACGEDQRAKMSRDRRMVDGLSSICRACSSASSKAYYAANRERASENARRRSATHPRESARRARDWYAANTERARANATRWSQENAGQVRALRVKAEASRRSRLAAATCDAAMDMSAVPFGCTHAGPFHLDHIVPVARGGCAHLHNLQHLCARCNQAKGASLPPVGTGCPVFWAERLSQS